MKCGNQTVLDFFNDDGACKKSAWATNGNGKRYSFKASFL